MVIYEEDDFKRFVAKIDEEGREVFDYSALAEEFDLTAEGITGFLGVFERTHFKKIILQGLDTSEIMNMNRTFCDCPNLESVDLKNLDLSKVEYMDSLFSGCSSLKEINLSGLNVPSLRHMYGMFCDCENLKTVDLSDFYVPGVKWLCQIFANCKSLVNVNLSNFNARRVDSTKDMFSNCKSLTHLDLSNFNVPNLNNADRMFHDCLSLQVVSLAEDSEVIRSELESELPSVNIISGDMSDYLASHTINESNVNAFFREGLEELFTKHSIQYKDLEDVYKMMHEIVEDEDYNLGKIGQSRSDSFQTTSMF